MRPLGGHHEGHGQGSTQLYFLAHSLGLFSSVGSRPLQRGGRDGRGGSQDGKGWDGKAADFAGYSALATAWDDLFELFSH